ncbi:unnamed protein product [Vitrella brassicaformis CCMP3155]|uniref:Uncharacterized protein n=1 Tax=Vitrella brassicaformis (strain CCMP3155) TaxID=1169540 RepID=A0A0G4G4P6_VITBC|nr:unnamed protein product [Vitrella brassicaformis CCMP3155]|mmetsp:Transcript_50905/g.127675  ORF Transcript_50905/g.127675 Transcript_50905/m.127675 type:complete len:327 (-) Transcript_50905:1424-2404(-)|eukprot:CEM23381.1 unnamed protein product [Vitrella brassicaformis CCMP3155]
MLLVLAPFLLIALAHSSNGVHFCSEEGCHIDSPHNGTSFADVSASRQRAPKLRNQLQAVRSSIRAAQGVNEKAIETLSRSSSLLGARGGLPLKEARVTVATRTGTSRAEIVPPIPGGAQCIINFKQVDEVPHSEKKKRRGDLGFGSVEVETQFFELMFAATMEGGLACDNGLPCVSNQPITVQLQHDMRLIGTARGVCTMVYDYNNPDECFVHLATSDGFAYCLNVQAGTEILPEGWYMELLAEDMTMEHFCKSHIDYDSPAGAPHVANMIFPGYHKYDKIVERRRNELGTWPPSAFEPYWSVHILSRLLAEDAKLLRLLPHYPNA